MRLEILLKVKVIYQSKSFILYSIDKGRDGNGNPLWYSCLENPVDGGAWQAAVHGVTGSQTRLSDFIFTFNFSCIGEGNDNPLQCSWLENPRDGEPGGLPSLRLHKSQTLLKKPSSSSIDYGAPLLAQLVKNPPAMWETWVQSLGWEDPLEKGKATHSSVLAWRIPWTVQSMGSQKVRQDQSLE